MNQNDVLLERNHTASLGANPGLVYDYPIRKTLKMFRQISYNRHFESETARVYDTGAMQMPIYLSLGQEHIPAAIAAEIPDTLIFAQHRAHSYYLSFGGDSKSLIDELLHRESGCAGGKGGSASIHSPEIGMYGHSGHMGDQVPIAVGAALATGKRVLTVVGDASGEEDYVYGAMGYAATKRTPVLFVCEDNNLSILTPVKTRRTWNLTDVAKSLGLHAVDISDDPWLIAHHVAIAKTKLPAFLNIRTCRHRWHAGTGIDGDPSWNRFEMIKKQLSNLKLDDQVNQIEKETYMEVTRLWREQLQKQ